MKTIWKFPLGFNGKNCIEVPEGALLLAVDNQQEVPCLWFQVDDKVDKEKRYFSIYSTDHPMPDETCDHVGTFLMMGGQLVFHVFETLS